MLLDHRIIPFQVALRTSPVTPKLDLQKQKSNKAKPLDNMADFGALMKESARQQSANQHHGRPDRHTSMGVSLHHQKTAALKRKEEEKKTAAAAAAGGAGRGRRSSYQYAAETVRNMPPLFCIIACALRTFP